MRITTLLVAIGLLASRPAYADVGLPITVTFQQPVANAVSEGLLTVRVSISSTFDLAEVRAIVDDREFVMPLALSSTGTFDLNGLSSGTKTLRVTATDVFGTSVSAERSFVLDYPPALRIESPGPTSVTRGSVTVNATCVDAESSCTLTAVYGGITRLTGTGSIHGAIDVSASTTSATITVTVGAPRNQPLSRTLVAYRETDPNWTDVVTLPGDIVDINEDRIFYASHSGSTIEQLIGIFDRNTEVKSESYLASGRKVQDGVLTIDGTLFNSSTSINTDWLLYEFSQSGITDVAGRVICLSSSGNYASWINGWNSSDLNLFSFSDHSNTIIHATYSGPSSAPRCYPPSPDGTVVYNSSDETYHSNIRLLNGSTEMFAPFFIKNITFDNDHIYYQTDDYTQLWVYDGGVHTMIASDMTSTDTYAVDNGWVAYTRPGNLGQRHVWLIAPDGTRRQMTFFSGDSDLSDINPTGEVMFRNANRQYLSTSAGVLKDLGAVGGTTRWIGGGWYRYRGSSLLEYNPVFVESEPVGPGTGAATEWLEAAPNPVSTSARVTFDLPRATTICLTVIDVLGRRVATLADGSYEAGSHAIAWETAGLHEGVYTLLMQTPTTTLTRPLTVAR